MSFFEELKRRNVFRVGIAYVVLAWLVLQVADVVLNNVEAPGWIFHVLLLFLAIGLPFAVFFAWAFELTPEGLKREHEVDRSQSITNHTGRKLDFLIIGVLVLALGYFAYDKFVLDAQRDTALVEATTQAVTEQVAADSVQAQAETPDVLANSIAVLPFVNMSSEEEQEYFSDGLAEELLNLLAKIPELRVTARTSSFAFREKDTPIREIASQLNVGHVLEGSVRKSGEQVRITAQLIEAGTESHLWSETWDRTLDDVFAIQDEIAAQVVEQLKVTLLGELPHTTKVDPEAYALYLQARHLHQQLTVESRLQAVAMYQQALDIETDFSLAWSGIGRAYGSLVYDGVMPIEEAWTLSEEATRKALALDPDNAEAHASLGVQAMYRDFDLASAAEHLKRALVLAPNDSRVLNSASTLLANLGRAQAGMATRQYAVRMDPLSVIGHANLGNSYEFLGLWNDAIDAYQVALRLNPSASKPWSGIGVALLGRGNSQAAHEAILKEPDEFWRLLGLSISWFALGDLETADTTLDELIARYQHDGAYNIAYVLAFRGEAERAFEWLNKAVEIRDGGLVEINSQRLFANLYDDPRWIPFLESIGKSPEQLAAIEFEVTLPGQ